MTTRRRRREEETEHENHERWMITYADMLTLLMVLFIVMFAISQVDQKRFEALRDGMAAGFGQTASPFTGATAVMPEAGTLVVPQIQPISEKGAKPNAQPNTQADAAERAARKAAAAREVARLDALRKRIDAALAKHGLRRDVQMKIDARGLTVSLVSRHIVFAPNLAELTPRGAKVLDVLAPVLRSIPEQIDVDGHTNQVKVKPKFYETDWDLSAARAVTVLRYLNERRGISASRLSAVAFGHEKPLIPVSDPNSQAINKRVDVVVVSGADEATRALFVEVLRDQGKL